jgi:hypothetical protein
MMMHGQIRLGAGTLLVPAPLCIGSVRMVGWRNLVVRPAVAALYDYVLNLLVPDTLKKRRIARRAEVVQRAHSPQDGTGKSCGQYRAALSVDGAEAHHLDLGHAGSRC